MAEEKSDTYQGGIELGRGFLPSPEPISPKAPKAHGNPFIDSRIRRRSTSIAVQAQLSSITAPMRENGESDFTGSDPELEAGSGDWDLGSVADFDEWEQDHTPDPARVEQDGEFLCGMSRDDDDFWSQYPGLD